VGAGRSTARARRPSKRHSCIGYRYLHTAIDDRTRLAYSEILDDEQGHTAAEFWHRAPRRFAAQGIPIERALTDNAMQRGDLAVEPCTAVTTPTVRPTAAPNGWTSPAICRASSRAGASTRPVGRRGVLAGTRVTIGIPEASVFARSGPGLPGHIASGDRVGRVSDQMGSGEEMPWESRASISARGTPRSENVVTAASGSSGTARAA
jgi:hypothetical protein